MSKGKHCKYCGCRTTNHSGICNTCTDKLMLVRKLRAIVFSIKHAAEREKHNEQTGNNPDIEKIQMPARGM